MASSNFFLLVSLAVLGLAWGSFVNALVWRLHEQSLQRKKRGKATTGKEPVARFVERFHPGGRYSILAGRSMCPVCRHALAASDLIPIVSWLSLRGKCRYCQAPISWQYPVVESVTALLFVVSYMWWPLSFSSGVGIFNFVLWLVFLTAFMALAVYDLRWYLLPDRIVFPVIALAVVQVVVEATIFGMGWQGVLHAAWGVLFSAGLFYALFEASRGRWIGFGDVKLAIALGLLVGGPLNALLLIFVASMLGTFVAVPMLVQGQAKASSQIPFGPFLIGAVIIVVLFGGTISSWYTGLFYLR